ncbi:MAG TPA: YciI family protein [Steroidobacteraceae bacterium]|jgi:hypothetical protein
MLYSVLIYGFESEVTSLSREQEMALLAQHEVIQKQLSAQRKLGPVVRLMPTTAAVTIRKGSEPVVIDGPFAETKEQLLGLYVLDCQTLEEAIEAAHLVGSACNSRSLEIRPISWFGTGDQITA